MKLKLSIALLFLTGSAFAQLIPMKEESRFLSSYNNAGSLFASNSDVLSIQSHAHFPAHISLTFQGSFFATPATTETPALSVSPRKAALDPVAETPKSGAEASSLSTILDLAHLSDVSRAQSDSSPFNHDQEVFALIAASTLP